MLKPVPHQNEALIEKLRKVEEIDRVIDLSRSTVQLNVLLYLRVRGYFTLDEAVKTLGYRRRTLLDAVRKLAKKRLLKLSLTGAFTLTDEGKRYLDKLLAVLDGNFTSAELEESAGGLEVLVKKVEMLSCLCKVLECLAYVHGHTASLTALARLTGLNPQKLRNYLDLYTDVSYSELKLFKRVKKPILASRVFRFMGVKPDDVYYRLTEVGLKVAYKLPACLKGGSLLTRLLLSMTKALSLEQALRRLLVFVILGTVVAYFSLACLQLAVSAAIVGAWLFLMVLLLAIVTLAEKV